MTSGFAQEDLEILWETRSSIRWRDLSLASNLYLNEVDRMLERAKEVTREDRWIRLEYARFADDLVVLVDGQPRYEWLQKAERS